MSSRLDRLFVLLESGSTASIRKAAANQLGEVQKSHPQDLLSLLKKVLKYLYNSNWDTRLAAAQAVEAILKNVPVWRPSEGVHGEAEGVKMGVCEGKMTLAMFDVKNLLENGQFLMSSEGKEFDVEKSESNNENNKLQQREKLNREFGFDKLGLKSEQFIDDEDLTDHQQESVNDKKKSASEILADEIKSIAGQDSLSSREVNRLKRKAKMDARASKKAEEEAENEPKKIKIDSVVVKNEANSENYNNDSEEVRQQVDFASSLTWPLESFYDQLVTDLFSPRWERRHGAATGLRELVKRHGQSGGQLGGCGREENDQRHNLWLEDLLVRLLSVLALDRFGDFVGDAVVCPVRESVGQVMGVVLGGVSTCIVVRVSEVVRHVMDNEEWHTRHAAMIIVKYILSVTQSDQESGRDTENSTVESLLVKLYPEIEAGLTDDNDDVVGVAATALLPVTGAFTRVMEDKVASLSSVLWDHTLHMDELTSSTHSIMALLAELLSHKVPDTDTPLASLVPRLYPFLSHNSSQVRRATLSCLLTLASTETVSQHWLAPCCQDALSQLYTRALTEHSAANLALVERVWTAICLATPLQPLLMASCPLFSHWLQLISGPPGAALQLGQARGLQYLGGPEAQPLTDPTEKAAAMWRARDTAAKMLGRLGAFIVEPLPDIVYTDIMETPLQMFLSKVLIPQLNTGSAYHRVGVSLLILHWLDLSPAPPMLGVSALPSVLLAALSQRQTYTEISSLAAKLASEAGDYVSSLKHFKLDVDAVLPTSGLGLTPDTVQQLVGPVSDVLLTGAKLKPKTLETIQHRRMGVASTLEVTVEEQTSLELLTLSSLAGAVAFIGHEALPEKLNPVIKPVMEALKKQSSEDIQRTAARSLARILKSCILRESSPNEKVVKNLCAFVCSNPEVTPVISLKHIQGQVHPTDGILTLYYNERNAEKATNSKSKRGRKPGPRASAAAVSSTPLQDSTDIDNEEDVKKVEIQRRGANLAVRELAEYFGHSLPESLPKLWEIVHTVILTSDSGPRVADTDPQVLVNSLSVLATLAPSLSPLLHPRLTELMPRLLQLSCHQLTAVRYMAAVTLSQLARLLTLEVMTAVVEGLVPRLEQATSEQFVRQGVIETLYCLCEQLQLCIVPYIVLLVVPVLGAMSDSDHQIRLLATSTFASLVRLMPLDGGVPEPENLSPELKVKKEREKEFLSQLLDSKTAASYELSVPVSAELRSYQVAGINWLAFLNKYKLHGILCDDMGLGKTLQSICMLAQDHKALSDKGVRVQSLVVCPTTLGGHWLEEVTKFVSRQHLNPFLYFGSPTHRASLRSQVPHHNLIITSYEIVRGDVEFLGSIKWNYLFLDEGHVIKNTKTKTAMAIRQLVAAHRVILTGTPIQNGVNELWALFDFLMPGYLGSEKQFTAKYSRPILNSRDAKSTSKEQEAGALAIEALHRQTLPFILRRVKEDVLDDLPPKITQDYYCELSPVQTELYEDFAKSQAKDNSSPTHVFQALQYLKKVCNHPRLVLTKEHPSYSGLVSSHLGGDIDNLNSIEHAAKLTALKQLLTDLGMAGSGGEPGDTGPIVSQHRALVFCQLKTMLDILESDLLKAHLPHVTYLRLDGSVPPAMRHSIVSRFNADPSIDLLLLSTSVGGLGLNLTGADTVIFVEHDWNPMKDLQAMDRAHRIGQKKVVNVYRLITRNTLEEKIMSLQQFKIHTAKSVISDENSSIGSMQTDQVLDLFSLDSGPGGASKAQEASIGGGGVKSVLDNLPELWNEEQYSEEYNMDSFIKNLK